MTRIAPGNDAAVVVRVADAELLGFRPQSIRLLVDSPSTGGRLSVGPRTPFSSSSSPGVERLEYFRQLARIATGHQAPEILLEVQERYDTFFETSSVWQQARRRPQ